jgi:hypothetical protein
MGGFDEHLCQTLVAQQSVTKFVAITATNLVTPKAAVRLELFSTNSCRFVGHMSQT